MGWWDGRDDESAHVWNFVRIRARGQCWLREAAEAATTAAVWRSQWWKGAPSVGAGTSSTWREAVPVGCGCKL